MLVTRMHKNDDKFIPDDYKTILLMSFPGKVLSRIVFNEIKLKGQEVTDESQFGSRPGRGTFDAIYIVRQIIENAKIIASHYYSNLLTSRLPLTLYGKMLRKMMIAIANRMYYRVLIH